MKVTFLGTNGWYDSQTGNTVCTLIEAEDRTIILDAGNGIHKLNRYKSVPGPAYLFLSHFHFDHIEGLHTLVSIKFEQGLKIIGQPGTKKALEEIIREPYTVPLAEAPYRIEVYDLPEGQAQVPFLADARYLIHASKCMGYRFNIDGKVVAYCTDTGVCDNLIELAKNADLLITECSARSGENSRQWPHLNPEDAAYIAKVSKAKKVVLTHFNAHRYGTVEDRKDVMERISKEFNGLIVAFDDMEIEV